MGRTVLIFGNYRQSLATARTLSGGAGAQCTVLATQKGGHESWSRFVKNVLPIENDQSIAPALQGNPEALLYPMGDHELHWLIQNPNQVPPGMSVLWAGAAVSALCLNKELLTAKATSLGIPCSPTFLGSTRDQRALERWASEVLFPVIAKPAHQGTSHSAFKMLRMDQIYQLRGVATLFREIPTQFQKYFAGFRRNIQFIAKNGTLQAAFQQKILRTTSTDGSGFGVEGYSESLDTELLGWTEKMIRDLSYSGVGCIQFLKNDQTQEKVFLELNARLDANLQHAIDCGYNFPLWHWSGETKPPKKTPLQRRFHWCSGDLQGWVSAVRSHQLSWIQILLWPFQTLIAFLRARSHFIFSFSDPAPALHAALMLPLRILKILMRPRL